MQTTTEPETTCCCPHCRTALQIIGFAGYYIGMEPDEGKGCERCKWPALIAEDDSLQSPLSEQRGRREG